MESRIIQINSKQRNDFRLSPQKSFVNDYEDLMDKV